MNRQERHRTNYKKLRSVGVNSKQATQLKFASPEKIDRIVQQLMHLPNYDLQIQVVIDKVMNDGKD